MTNDLALFDEKSYTRCMVKTAQICEHTLEYLLNRRSVKPDMFNDKAPSDAEIETILTAAARVPDHGRMAPFRFIVFKGDARERAGDVFAEAFSTDNPDAGELQIARERERFLRAPLVIGVVFSPQEGKIPEAEQRSTAGAVCQNLGLAAHTMGYGCVWLTGWMAYDLRVLSEFGLSADEEIAGFLYIGGVDGAPEERERPDISSLTTHF